MPTFPRDERPPPSAFGVEPFDVSQRSATRSATAGARATWFSLTSSCVCRSGKAGAPPSPAHTRAHTLVPARAPSDRRHQRQILTQVDWGLLYRNVGIHPEEIRDLKRSSHMTLNLLPGYWQVQPEPEASLKDPTTPLSRATVVHQRDPAKRRSCTSAPEAVRLASTPRTSPPLRTSCDAPALRPTCGAARAASARCSRRLAH